MVATDQRKAEPSCELDTSPVPFGHVSTHRRARATRPATAAASMTGTQLLRKMTERPSTSHAVMCEALQFKAQALIQTLVASTSLS